MDGATCKFGDMTGEREKWSRKLSDHTACCELRLSPVLSSSHMLPKVSLQNYSLGSRGQAFNAHDWSSSDRGHQSHNWTPSYPSASEFWKLSLAEARVAPMACLIDHHANHSSMSSCHGTGQLWARDPLTPMRARPSWPSSRQFDARWRKRAPVTEVSKAGRPPTLLRSLMQRLRPCSAMCRTLHFGRFVASVSHKA